MKVLSLSARKILGKKISLSLLRRVNPTLDRYDSETNNIATTIILFQ
jgi:hypothetical protein